MLPKQAVPEGSRMVLNGEELWITHIFTTELGNVYETTTGEFIFPNGKPVNNRAFLEALPEQHKQRAFAWWDQTFGGVEKDLDVEARPAGRKITKAELLAKARFLMEQAEMMEDEEEQEGESTETIAAGPGPQEQTEPASGRAAQPKDTSVKRSPKTKETSVLSQMGIRT